MSEDEDVGEFAEDGTESQRDEHMLDDDAVFGMFKKHVCTPNFSYVLLISLYHICTPPLKYFVIWCKCTENDSSNSPFF